MPHERMSQYETSDQDAGPAVAGAAQRVYGQARELVRENPAYSALATFGMGAAVGLALGLMLMPARRQKEQRRKEAHRWYEGYLPEGMSAECIAKQVRETVSRVLPDAVSRYMGRR